MKAIKIWKIGKDEKNNPVVQPLTSSKQTETETHLEEILVRSPDLLLDGLKLVGRQTETPGGPLDLLGVDGDGNLVVFELKKGTLTREAIAQIIDYASSLSELGPEELSRHITERSGKLGIDKINDFPSWFQQQFTKEAPAFQKPKMVLVGLGVDERTRRMVSFLSKSELDISLVTFYGFDKDGETFLAKHVEVEAPPPPPTRITKSENLKKLQQKVSNLQIQDYYYEMSSFFRDRLSAYEWPNPGGYSYYLSEETESGTMTQRCYVALYIYDSHPGKVKISLYPRAGKAAHVALNSIKQKLGKKINLKPDGSAEIWINSTKDWIDQRTHLEEICASIMAGWKTKQQQQIEEEFQEVAKDIEESEKT